MDIAGLFKELWKYTAGEEALDWRLRLGILLIIAAYFMLRAGVAENDSRRALVRWLRRGTYKDRYRALMLELLLRTDRLVLTPEQFTDFSPADPRRAFSKGLLEKSLALAFVYAPAVFFVQLLLGSASVGQRAELEIGGNAHLWVSQQNWVFATFLPLLLALFLRNRVSRGALAITGVVAGLLIWPFDPAMVKYSEIETSLSWAMAYDIAINICVSAIVGTLFAVIMLRPGRATGMAIVTSFSGLLLLGPIRALLGGRDTLLWWLDWHDYIAAKVATPLSELMPEMVWLLVPGGAVELTNFVMDRSWMLASLVLCFILVWLAKWIYPFFQSHRRAVAIAILGLFAMQIALASRGFGNPVYFVVFCALPLVNALFDFLSFGVTRLYLRKGIRRIGWDTIKWALFDLVTALALFIGLLIGSLVWLHLLNLASPDQLMAIKSITNDEFATTGVLEYLADDGGEHNWLLIILVSTLIPTLTHAFLATFAVGPALLRRPWANWLAELFETATEHYFRRNLGLLVLSIWCAVSLLVPFFGVQLVIEALQSNLGGVKMGLVYLMTAILDFLPNDTTLRFLPFN